MSKVFVGGSRSINRLSEEVRRRLDQIVKSRIAVLVGDANGADKAFQNFFRERHYANVDVFCTEGYCRNNLAQWPVRSIKPPHKTQDFAFFTAKDAAMAREADSGLMVWNGNSAGTLVQMIRLVTLNKPVEVFLNSQRRFLTLRSRNDLAPLLALYPKSERSRVDKYISKHVPGFRQPSLID